MRTDAISAPVSRAGAPSGVELTLDTPPVDVQLDQGDRHTVALEGTWQSSTGGPVYLQASDSEDMFEVAQPELVPSRAAWSIAVTVPGSLAAGKYAGSLTVRACADAMCLQVFPGTTRSVPYSIGVEPVGEWKTLQRTSRHDGYVPVRIEPWRYRLAWTWQRPSPGSVSAVVTDGANVYVSEPAGSLYALRASDGAPQWRRVFPQANAVNPPTVSDGHVYVATTCHQETWLYALRGTDGQQAYQSAFETQWARILNPAVRNGKAYVISGSYGGVVYAFDQASGTRAWSASGGTYGMNAPAVDDDYVYAYNGTTMNILDAGDGSLARSIGPNPMGVQTDYNATPMIGSADHVLTYNGTAYNMAESQRQLIDFSAAGGNARWLSFSLYSNLPAVARGVVYATSNETRTLDALDEATGQRLWSWSPAEPMAKFVGNVVVTDNVAFVSTQTHIHAIDLGFHKSIWTAPTPGTMSLSANRMLFVSSTGEYNSPAAGRVTAYRLE